MKLDRAAAYSEHNVVESRTLQKNVVFSFLGLYQYNVALVIGSMEPAQTFLKTVRASSYSPDNQWTDAEVKVLAIAWAEGLPIKEIVKLLPKRDYAAITRKAWRLGLPTRRGVQRSRAVDANEDLLELEADDPSWKYLDRNYTEEEVREAYAARPKPNVWQAYCKNGCGTLCVFESPYQRWCDPCRKEMNNIYA